MFMLHWVQYHLLVKLNIYLFIHFISYRRFQDNISKWELLYIKQIEQDMFHC